MKPKDRGKWEKQRKPLKKQKKAAERRVEKTSWLPPRWRRAPSGRWEALCAPRSLPAPRSLLPTPGSQLPARPNSLLPPPHSGRSHYREQTTFLSPRWVPGADGKLPASCIINQAWRGARSRPRLPAGRGRPAVPTGPAAPPAPTARGACSP